MTGRGQERRLFITMLLNFLITAVEVIGGIVSGSLSLLSDALHNFSDGLAVIITYSAIRLSKRPRTLKYTFGLKRAEILAAIINASTLFIISFFLIKEAIERFISPAPITGSLMLIIAAVGLVGNIAGSRLLKKGSDVNINIRAAYLHLLSDAASSVAVMVGSLFIIIFDITWIDSILTIVISLYILKEAYVIVKESIDVIMMSTPSDIDMSGLRRVVESTPGVKNIHHVHIWKLNDSDIHFESHIDVDDCLISNAALIRAEIEGRLHDSYDITHTTLQIECDACATKDLV